MGGGGRWGAKGGGQGNHSNRNSSTVPSVGGTIHRVCCKKLFGTQTVFLMTLRVHTSLEMRPHGLTTSDSEKAICNWPSNEMLFVCRYVRSARE